MNTSQDHLNPEGSAGTSGFQNADVMRSLDADTPEAAEPSAPEPRPIAREPKAGSAEAEQFLEAQFGDLAAIAGLRGIRVSVAQRGEGWSTNMQTGNIKVDPSFFLEQGYRPEWCVYGTMHEMLAHLKMAVTDPETAQRESAHSRKSKPHHLFHNILSDVAGNRDIARHLPVMADVAPVVYREKLFPEVDYSSRPRHIQLLYKIIRDEMIPGSDAKVTPDVQEVIDRLRNFRGSGEDVIKRATDPRTTYREQQDIRMALIWPEYFELLKQDIEDRKKNPQPEGEPGEGGGESGEGGEPTEGSTEPTERGIGREAGEIFSDDYKDAEGRHAEPISDDELGKVMRDAKKMPSNQTPEQRAKAAAEKQTGHTSREIQKYRETLTQHWPQVDTLVNDYFSQIISRRLATAKRFKGGQRDGATIDGSSLAQGYADFRGGGEPYIFNREETHEKLTQAPGGYDVFLVIDGSGSMGGQKAEMAAASGAIMLEALNQFQEQITESEVSHRVNLGLDIRTQVSIFGSDSTDIKPLSGTLTEKNRLDTFVAATAADAGGTGDYLTLEQIISSYDETLSAEDNAEGRKRLVIVLTDGESDNKDRASASIKALRSRGFLVHAISIGSPAAAQLYSPSGREIRDPGDLPAALIELLESEINE
jgi:Mg-chelatase subunit ChlD